jgi:hypothetical protein
LLFWPAKQWLFTQQAQSESGAHVWVIPPVNTRCLLFCLFHVFEAQLQIPEGDVVPQQAVPELTLALKGLLVGTDTCPARSQTHRGSIKYQTWENMNNSLPTHTAQTVQVGNNGLGAQLHSP